MWKITNTSMDRSKALLHRTAPKLEMEPIVAGKRLRMRQTMTISDHEYEHDKAHLEQHVRAGSIAVEKIGEDKKKVPAPPPAPPPVKSETVMHPPVKTEPPPHVEEQPLPAADQEVKTTLPTPKWKGHNKK
jgi:type IV secretory pathway VirB10-like protein